MTIDDLQYFLLPANFTKHKWDAAALLSLKNQWQNLPPSWGNSTDPCGAHWDGVDCDINSRVTQLVLSTTNLKGTLGSDIAELSELKSFALAGCSFSGRIPGEIGNLANLSFLALNSNNVSGKIPASLGNLSNLNWLDLADNQLTGRLPVSTKSTPGLDLLLKAKHFHFNKNQQTGSIPPKLFSFKMVLIHVILNENQLTGEIPSTLGVVKTLEILWFGANCSPLVNSRLDRNSLNGTVPSNLNNLTSLNELHLANNLLTGPVPDLTGMNLLNYVDLSNNSFDPSEAPKWFSTLQSLRALGMENGKLHGVVPQKLFNLPQLQQVLLKDNTFNGTLAMGGNIGQQLQLVDFENNQISAVTLRFSYKMIIILKGNPACVGALSNTSFCQLVQEPQELIPNSTSLPDCGSKSCASNEKLNPQNCECAYPNHGSKGVLLHAQVEILYSDVDLQGLKLPLKKKDAAGGSWVA
ncbi:hypothetical protein IFM89_013528 [Coptis chinensis]|uniref:non-specific serine/threonine protein kinase n=1 Tax=Coptis chinensis TaxID=261450 RepID=A0A835H5Y6_9MAGN|nr:hypothetical protein IFM89_013528 [Coptis chinensis]